MSETNTRRTGPVLATDRLDKYQALGAFGQPVYVSHVQLRATILQRLGPRHANFFARPDRNPEHKVVQWVSEVPGEPRRWVDLSEDERVRRALDLHALRADFLGYLEELRRKPGSEGTAGQPPQQIKGPSNQAGSGAAAFASLLEQALLVPDDSHLHFVGDQPVVSFWGFRKFERPGTDPLAVAVPRRAASAPGGTATASAAAPAMDAAVKLRRPWWHWLLLALLLLALLALILFGVSQCLSENEKRAILGEPPLVSDQSKDQQATVVEQEGGIFGWTRRVLGLGGTTTDGSVSGTLRPDGTVVPGDATGEGEGAKTPADAAKDQGPDANKSEQPTLPDASKPDEQTQGEEKPEQPNPDAAQPPQPDQTNPDAQKPDQPGAQPPKPEDQGKTNQQDKSGQQDKSSQQGQAQPLQIPADAGKTGNLGFLGGGEWRSQGGLIDQATKQPLQQSYQFDKDGQGTVTVRRPDGTACRAAARAQMQGGALSINELGDPTCPDGRTYARSQTKCVRTPSGQTVCQGQNADGSTYRVGIERGAGQPTAAAPASSGAAPAGAAPAGAAQTGSGSTP